MASIDEDTLKTLQRIEKQLANAFPTGRRADFAGSPAQTQSTKATSSKEAREAKGVLVATMKSINTLGTVASTTSRALTGFQRNTKAASSELETLVGSLGKTISSLGSARGSLGKLNFTVDTSGVETTMARVDSVLDNKLLPRLGTFSSALSLSTRALLGAWTDLKDFSKQDLDVTAVSNNIKAIGQAFEGATGGGGLKQQVIRSTRLFRELNKELRTGTRGSRTSAGGAGGGGDGANSASAGKDKDPSKSRGSETEIETASKWAGIWTATLGILRNGVESVDDMFQVVAARGLGAAGAMFELYGDSIMAGMSLREYAKVLDENNGALSRATSLDDFNDQLDNGTDQLAKFGVFGQEATELAAAMNNSATLLGIPQSQLADATNAQIGVFEQLRKTTTITAEAFTELVKEMKDNEVIQRELIGLAPRERAARQEQLTKTMTWGRQLGLSEQAQRQLTQALIDQRKSTVKERFQARGRISQAFALAGMSADEGNEARTLAAKRNRTTEEDQRLTTLLGEYNARSEQAKQSGNEGLANQFESMDALLGETAIKPLLDASTAVGLAQQSGPQQNPDLAKTLGDTYQLLGKGFAVLEGIVKNPLAAAAATALTGVAMWMTGRAFANILGTRIGVAVATAIGRTPGGVAVGGADVPGRKPGIKGRVSGALGSAAKLGGKALPFVGGAIGLATAGLNFADAENQAKVENGGDGDVGKLQGAAIGEGIGAAAGTAIGAVVGSIVPVIGTTIGGLLGSVLGGWGGKLIGGLLGSEDAAEKQAKETKKNTEELIKARRATAEATDVSSTNLASLTYNVQKTAAAYQTPQNQPGTTQVTVKPGSGSEPATVTQATYDAMGNVTGFEEVPIAATTPRQSKILASPSQTPMGKSISTTVNSNVDQEAQATQAAATRAASAIATPAAPTADEILNRILLVLEQSLTAETTQVELVEQLIRTRSNRLPDNQVLAQRVIRS